MNLSKVIDVDPQKCINCHACIAVCPVKYCNDGSGEYVAVDANSCLGCGKCLSACTHHARIGIDDLEAFKSLLARREPAIAVVAPAVASNFPGRHLHLNGWLKSVGFAAVFDVSFGAELTVKSYLEHIRSRAPKTVIAQPCPAIVTYIEVYHPELLPHLAPAHSPLLHTITLIREYYPQYRDHKMVFLSPCYAKKRELEATGASAFALNVTFRSLDAYLREQQVNLDLAPQTEFDNPPAERAVGFSSPGGLLFTAEREEPGIGKKSRKIEGPQTVYPYLAGLERSVTADWAPLLIDCLSCETGCNGGAGHIE